MLKPLLRAALALALLSSPVLGQQVWKWSQTPATNASADPAINWATGMAPSAVSPSARAMMAAVAKYRDDVGGLIATAGTSTAYTLTSNSSVSATPPNGYVIGFTPHVTNGASATLAADGGTAFPIRVDASNAVPAAALVLGSPYLAVFSTGSNGWILHGYYGSPSAVPVGAVLDYAGTTAPNSNFALAYGQEISRTTYAGLFAQVGTTFGVGNGTTTFNLPDTRGRAVFGKDDMGGAAASKITVAGGNFDGTVLGGTGGLQNHTLLTAEMPSHTHTGTTASNTLSISGTTDSGGVDHTHAGTTGIDSVDHHHDYLTAPSTSGQFSGLIGPNNGWGGAPTTATTSGIGSQAHTHSFTTGTASAVFHTHTFSATGGAHTHTFTSNATGGGGAHTILPPAIILSKIIRIF